MCFVLIYIIYIYIYICSLPELGVYPCSSSPIVFFLFVVISSSHLLKNQWTNYNHTWQNGSLKIYSGSFKGIQHSIRILIISLSPKRNVIQIGKILWRTPSNQCWQKRSELTCSNEGTCQREVIIERWIFCGLKALFHKILKLIVFSETVGNVCEVPHGSCSDE